ncbi:LOW QUALITY PROTEIN: hypothetical protein TorRG33x02_144520 [Trema orientale]|uniref:Uncharacterized protein n=1 Tax=Trema orientale TaxID=63057 RepID=A0A2P5EW59_TREOI|nr:LOW QUALITY PROTEIN: hypothetical protein TorRG33x02_144520 [Trema orientale]
MWHSSLLRDKIDMLRDPNFLGNLLTLRADCRTETIELFAWHAWLLWFYKNKWVHNKREIPVHVIAYQAQAKWKDFKAPNPPPVAIQAAQTQSWKQGGPGGRRPRSGKVMVAFSHSYHLNCSAEIAEAMDVCKGIRIA